MAKLYEQFLQLGKRIFQRIPVSLQFFRNKVFSLFSFVKNKIKELFFSKNKNKSELPVDSDAPKKRQETPVPESLQMTRSETLKVQSAAQLLKEIFDPLILKDRVDLNMITSKGTSGIDLYYYEVFGAFYYQNLISKLPSDTCRQFLSQAFEQVVRFKSDFDTLKLGTLLKEKTDLVRYLLEELNKVIVTFENFTLDERVVIANLVGNIFLKSLEENLPLELRNSCREDFKKDFLCFVDSDLSKQSSRSDSDISSESAEEFQPLIFNHQEKHKAQKEQEEEQKIETQENSSNVQKTPYPSANSRVSLITPSENSLKDREEKLKIDETNSQEAEEDINVSFGCFPFCGNKKAFKKTKTKKTKIR